MALLALWIMDLISDDIDVPVWGYLVLLGVGLFTISWER